MTPRHFFTFVCIAVQVAALATPNNLDLKWTSTTTVVPTTSTVSSFSNSDAEYGKMKLIHTTPSITLDTSTTSACNTSNSSQPSTIPLCPTPRILNKGAVAAISIGGTVGAAVALSVLLSLLGCFLRLRNEIKRQGVMRSVRVDLEDALDNGKLPRCDRALEMPKKDLQKSPSAGAHANNSEL